MSKKIFSVLVLSCLLITMAMPVLAKEEVPTGCTIRKNPRLGGVCPAVGSPCDYDTDYGSGENIVSGALCCLFSTVYFLTDWAFTIFMILTVVMVLLGAFTILTAGGNSDKVNQGRDYLMFAAIGLAVALLARAIPAIVRFMMAA